MKWPSIRNMYPNQFVKLKALSIRTIDGKEIIEDIEFIEAVDNKKATKELLKSKGDEFVFHTAHEEIVLEIRQDMGFMRIR